MATTKPRIQVTLDQEQYRSISRFAQVMGKSRSAVVGELVSEMLPILDQLGDVLELARELDKEGRSAFRSMGMGKVGMEERRIDGLRDEALQGMHRLFLTLEADLESAREDRQKQAQAASGGVPPQGGRAPDAAGNAASTPVPVTRGLKHSGTGVGGPRGALADETVGGRSHPGPARPEGSLRSSRRG